MRHWDHKKIYQLIHDLELYVDGFVEPMSFFLINEFGKDPFLILVSCLLSLRARDTSTYPLCKSLFKYYKTPVDFATLDIHKLESLIYSIGFYKRKARTIKEVSAFLINKYNGRVPSTQQELLALPGVGIKTAHLVLGLAYDIPALCVDIHVHRLSNLLGIVTTKTPEKTERALQNILPRDVWINWNRLLVMWGQNRCLKRSPACYYCAHGLLFCPEVMAKKYISV